MSAAVRIPPVLDRRGYVVPSVGLHLVLVVLGATDRDHPVVIEADAESLLVGRLLGVSRLAPAGAGVGKLFPSVAFDCAGDKSSQLSLHVIFG